MESAPPEFHMIDDADRNGAGRVKAPPPQDGSQEKQILHPLPGPAGSGLLDLLRVLSAEVLDLQGILSQIKKGETALDISARYIVKTTDDIEKLLAAIAPLAEGPTVSDTVRHIFNTWEQMITNPILIAPDGTFEAQSLIHSLDNLDGQINKMVFLCGSMTVPNRLDDWLKNTRPGYYIPFHQVFEDEIPNQDARQRLLKFLAWAPKAVKDGYIDMESGLVYRYSHSLRERWLNFLYLVLAFCIITGVVIGMCYIALPGWPLAPANVTTVLFGWLALLVGLIAHIGIGTIKRQRDRGGLPELFATSDVLIVINTRMGQILLKLFLALIGFFALVFSSGLDNVTILNTFLVGYSLDSFVEMFGSTLEQRATGQLNAMQQKLNSEG